MHLDSSHYFVLFVVETLGVLGRQQRTSYGTWADSSTGQLENPVAKSISCRESQLQYKGGTRQRCWEWRGLSV